MMQETSDFFLVPGRILELLTESVDITVRRQQAQFVRYAGRLSGSVVDEILNTSNAVSDPFVNHTGHSSGNVLDNLSPDTNSLLTDVGDLTEDPSILLLENQRASETSTDLSSTPDYTFAEASFAETSVPVYNLRLSEVNPDLHVRTGTTHPTPVVPTASDRKMCNRKAREAAVRKEQRKRKYICKCGSKVSHLDWYIQRHKRTKGHRKFMQQQRQAANKIEFNAQKLWEAAM